MPLAQCGDSRTQTDIPLSVRPGQRLPSHGATLPARRSNAKPPSPAATDAAAPTSQTMVKSEAPAPPLAPTSAASSATPTVPPSCLAVMLIPAPAPNRQGGIALATVAERLASTPPRAAPLRAPATIQTDRSGEFPSVAASTQLVAANTIAPATIARPRPRARSRPASSEATCQHRGTDRLSESSPDERGEARSGSARGGPRDEHRGPDDQHLAVADRVGQPARRYERGRKDSRVRRDAPGQVDEISTAEASPDVGERQVHDGDIEKRQERHDRRGGQKSLAANQRPRRQ
jgi:hypothetical protein